jgi:hypothetical protein
MNCAQKERPPHGGFSEIRSDVSTSGGDWFEMNEAAKAHIGGALYKFHTGLAYFPPYKPAPPK